jgi:hypothetical protein
MQQFANLGGNALATFLEVILSSLHGFSFL